MFAFKGGVAYRALMERIVNNPGLIPEDAHVAKTEGNYVVYSLPDPVAPHEKIFVKIIPAKRGLLKNVGYLFRQSRATGEYSILKRAISCGLRVPEPLASAELRRKSSLKFSVLITKSLPYPVIEHHLRQVSALGNAKEAGSILYSLGVYLRGLHDRGIVPRDVKPDHVTFSLSPEGIKFGFVDAASTRFVPRATVFHRASGLYVLLYGLGRMQKERILDSDSIGRFWEGYNGSPELMKRTQRREERLGVEKELKTAKRIQSYKPF